MTVSTFDPNSPVINITPPALSYFEKNLKAEQAKGEPKIIRLSTKESGCTGYAYVLDMVLDAEASDKIMSFGDVSLAIAGDAVELLRGTEIDMVTEGVNHVIKFNNPNVVAECGCGESFSVA
jgi:Fe-S cluster assembly protein SufA/iron-sulfur cluster assembly protein